MRRLPTPREWLIALHADWRLPPRQRGRLVAEAMCWAQGSPPPDWATPSGVVASAQAATAGAAALGAHLVTLVDPDYPEILARMTLPPPVLGIRGRLPPGPAVAIVGSRLADGYGREVAGTFARCLAAAGVAVVSGLARGVDEAAHRGALALPLGRTVAVLGCGLGVAYPRGQARLAETIAERGAVMSEFPCDATPRPWRFPVRNRTIAGLAAVTLVVQATPRSGSLDTARHARDLERRVYAVPGPVFAPLSWGPHALLRRGALLAGHPQDLLDALLAWAGGAAAETGARRAEETADGVTAAVAANAAPAESARFAVPISAPAAAVAATLRRRAARSAEQVASLCGLTPGAVLSALLELEMAGEIERLCGPAYRLRTPRRAARRGRSAPAP